jgi:hypothetical protein
VHNLCKKNNNDDDDEEEEEEEEEEEIRNNPNEGKGRKEMHNCTWPML